MQLVEDCLRQDELPSVNVFPPKADFQLRTPDAKGANRPSHPACDFPITESLVDKGGDQRWICLALSHEALPRLGQSNGFLTRRSSAAYLLENVGRAIYRKLYGPVRAILLIAEAFRLRCPQ